MLMQLVIEQDVNDRQQIGLFGVKKNSEILGVNQSAVDNNYKKGPVSTPQAQTSQNLWDMPNKNKTYNKSDIYSRDKFENVLINKLNVIVQVGRIGAPKQHKSSGTKGCGEGGSRRECPV